MFNSTSNLTMLMEDQRQQKLVEEMKEHFMTQQSVLDNRRVTAQSPESTVPRSQAQTTLKHYHHNP